MITNDWSGTNYQGPCAACGKLIVAYDSNYQTRDRTKHYHRECVERGAVPRDLTRLLYYTDG